MIEKMKKWCMAVLPVLLLLAIGIGMVVTTDAKVSKTERRHLAQAPTLSIDTITDGSYMEKLEKYLKDQMLGRDVLRSVKAETEIRLLGKNDAEGYFPVEDGIYELETELSEENVIRASQQFSAIVDTYLPDANVYVAMIPDKTSYVATELGYPYLDYGTMEELIQQNFSDAHYISIAENLELSDYYRTDLHWRQEKIGDVAQQLLAEMGTESTQEWEVLLAKEQFLGGYAGASGFYMQPEELNYVTNPTIAQAILYDYEEQKGTDLYDWAKLEEEMDDYNFFLQGPKALLTLTNPSMEQSGKKILLFRDSFGSSIAPLLLQGYAEITLIDLRYVSMATAQEMIQMDSYDTVLFLYSQSMLHHSNSMKF